MWYNQRKRLSTGCLYGVTHRRATSKSGNSHSNWPCSEYLSYCHKFIENNIRFTRMYVARTSWKCLSTSVARYHILCDVTWRHCALDVFKRVCGIGHRVLTRVGRAPVTWWSDYLEGSDLSDLSSSRGLVRGKVSCSFFVGLGTISSRSLRMRAPYRNLPILPKHFDKTYTLFIRFQLALINW